MNEVHAWKTKVCTWTWTQASTIELTWFWCKIRRRNYEIALDQTKSLHRIRKDKKQKNFIYKTFK